jgi:hypothetical protein
MIKNKQDVIEIVNGLMIGNVLNYSTDSNNNSFSYDADTKQFVDKSESKISRFKSTGSMTYDVIVHQIWIDRKYINKLVNR